VKKETRTAAIRKDERRPIKPAVPPEGGATPETMAEIPTYSGPSKTDKAPRQARQSKQPSHFQRCC